MMGTADIRHLVLAFNKEGATNKQKAELTKVCAKIIKCRQKFLGSARKVVNQKTGGGYRNGGLVGFGTCISVSVHRHTHISRGKPVAKFIMKIFSA